MGRKGGGSPAAPQNVGVGCNTKLSHPIPYLTILLFIPFLRIRV